MESKIIAVDFDGVLCEDRYPKIGEPNMENIQYFKRVKENGHKLILWTCRRGIYLNNAVAWCRKYGLEFDAVNENLPEMVKRFHGDSRKIFADIYYDDRNCISKSFRNNPLLEYDPCFPDWAFDGFTVSDGILYTSLSNKDLHMIVYENGESKIYDSSRVIFSEIETDLNDHLYKSLARDFIDSLYPIKFPYIVKNKPYKLLGSAKWYFKLGLFYVGCIVRPNGEMEDIDAWYIVKKINDTYIFESISDRKKNKMIRKYEKTYLKCKE